VAEKTPVAKVNPPSKIHNFPLGVRASPDEAL
jgi:hypothetical protein